MESRVRVAMGLYVFGALGVFLLAAPWSPIWEFATSVLLPTSMGGWVRSGWARGAISGLGFLDLLVAIQETERLRQLVRRGGAVERESSEWVGSRDRT